MNYTNAKQCFQKVDIKRIQLGEIPRCLIQIHFFTPTKKIRSTLLGAVQKLCRLGRGTNTYLQPQLEGKKFASIFSFTNIFVWYQDYLIPEFQKNQSSAFRTIHLRRRQFFMIFNPYPPPVGNHRHSSKMPPSKKDIGIWHFCPLPPYFTKYPLYSPKYKSVIV